MRHLVAHRKLGRTSAHRKALLRNLCASLVEHERLITTLPKAKELRPFAEQVITLGRRALKARNEGQTEVVSPVGGRKCRTGRLHSSRIAASGGRGEKSFFAGKRTPVV